MTRPLQDLTECMRKQRHDYSLGKMTLFFSPHVNPADGAVEPFRKMEEGGMAMLHVFNLVVLDGSH